MVEWMDRSDCPSGRWGEEDRVLFYFVRLRRDRVPDRSLKVKSGRTRA